MDNVANADAAPVDGIVLLGHGSRAPSAREVLQWVADRLGERVGCRVVAASLQFNRPTLEEGCLELADTGSRHVVVAPYFLFPGNHLRIDIPGELQALRERFPDVRFTLADPLGADDRLVDLACLRIGQAADGMTGEAQQVTAEGTEAGFGDPAAYGAEQGQLPAHPIERQSFDIIDSLLGMPAGSAAARGSDPEYEITRRVIHATGDLSLARALVFSPGAVGAGVEALRKCSQIICDVNMVSAGITPTASQTGIDVKCEIADEETARLAADAGMTRGAAGMRRMAQAGMLEGAVVTIGNAPTALFECLRLIEESGVRPALIVGVPVGFVGAAESKEALAASPVPFITLPGNRGGSNIAVAMVNALIRMTVNGGTGRTSAVQAIDGSEGSSLQAVDGPEGPSR